MATMISLEDISKTYYLGEIDVPVLKHVDLSIEAGEYVAIMGASGSGKSTLMNIIGCLDRPTSGRYFLAGTDLTTLNDDELADIRNQYVGFVFQQFNLLPRLTALANVMLPMIYADIPRSQRILQATEALELVGLQEQIQNRPLVLADEQTGALDSKTSQEIIDLLTELNQQGTTIAIVTHDANVAAQTKRVIHMQDGAIVETVKC